MDALTRIVTTRRATEQDGDYKKDGLLYCGKCDTPKEARAMLFDREIICGIMCKCEEKQNNTLKEKLKQMELREKIKDLNKQGITDAEYLSCTFENDDKKDLNTTIKCRDYVDNFKENKEKNIGILFHGSVGTGKSFFACAIANALIDKNIPVLVTNFPRLIKELASYDIDLEEYLDKLNRYDLLVIDDLGVERGTETAVEIVNTVIDARWRSRKPMIITTNLKPQEILAITNIDRIRIFDRVIQNCIPIQFNGTSRRKEIAKEKREEYAKRFKDSK